MRILKLLNRNISKFLFIAFFSIIEISYSVEPVDIWDIEKNHPDSNSPEITFEENESKTNSVFDMQKDRLNKFKILKDDNLQSDKINLVGLYDPQENGLKIDMWTNSNGEQIKDIFNKIKKIDLSQDSKEILNIALFTNSYFPENNISTEDFLDFHADYLIKNNNLDLIKTYINKNQNIANSSKLIRHYVDSKLSDSDIEGACDIFNQIKLVSDDYLSKFQIYCLINEDKREEAQLQFDLNKEIGFKDIFFEQKFNLLMGYQTENNKDISEENILNFHLSHRTDPDFSFSPDENTVKIIWKYLSSSNLLENVELIDLEDIEKIKIIEKATHEKNYTEQELFDLYKRFQFNINQLLNVKDTYKLLPSYEARALLYQRLILTIDVKEKLDLAYKLKESFSNDAIPNAFNVELSKVLKEIQIEDVPANYSEFFEKNLIAEKVKLSKIKFNNKIIHQSKLLNYLSDNSEVDEIEKDIDDLLKKIRKKDKKYYFSTKDIILLETLKSDGVKIDKKNQDIYEINDPDIPYDIQIMIKNNETGLMLLRLVEIIGQDELKDLGTETLYFIISALNQLNLDPIRDKILLKVLPLKV